MLAVHPFSAAHAAPDSVPQSFAGDGLIVTYTDSSGYLHRRACSRHLRRMVPMDTQVASRGVDPALFVRDATQPTGATPLSDALLICGRDPDIRDVAVCAVVFERVCGAGEYAAPLFARLWSGAYAVIDLPAHPMPRYVRKACVEIGWTTATVVAPGGIELRNLRMLACDQYDWVIHGYERDLEMVCALAHRPTSLRALCVAVDPVRPETIEPVVNYAIWHELVCVDWTSPITPLSVVGPASSGTLS